MGVVREWTGESSCRGHRNTRSGRFAPGGGETSGVTLNGNGFVGEDRWGKGGDKKSPATQETKGANTALCISMYAGMHGPAAQLHLQSGGTASKSIFRNKEQEASMQAADAASAVGSRPGHITSCKYGALTLEESTEVHPTQVP